MSDRWSWREAGPADHAEQARLFNLCFGKRKDEHTMAWKYARNPHGPALARVAVDERGHIVAGYSFVPRRFRRDGRPLLLAQASDAMVEPAWRRRGLFRALDDVVCEAAGREGVPLAFAYSGRLSLNGFLANGWRLSGHARPYRYRFRSRRGMLRGGRLSRWSAWSAPVVDAAWRRRDARRFPAGRAAARLVPVERFGDEAEDLFEACVPARGLIGERDAAWLNWRYVDTPSRRQEVFVLPGPGERWDGYLVAEFADGLAYLVDHLARDAASREALLSGFTGLARERGSEEASALLFAHDASAPVLERLGWAAPLKRKPFRDIFPFIIRSCASAGAGGHDEITAWHLADGDRDAEHVSPELTS